MVVYHCANIKIWETKHAERGFCLALAQWTLTYYHSVLRECALPGAHQIPLLCEPSLFQNEENEINVGWCSQTAFCFSYSLPSRAIISMSPTSLWAFLALFCEILTATSLFHAFKHSLLFEKLKKHAFWYLGSTSAMLCTLGTIMEWQLAEQQGFKLKA